MERNGKKLGRMPIGITIQIEDNSPGSRTPRCEFSRTTSHDTQRCEGYVGMLFV